MLVENTQPCHRSVGDLYLQPGCNRIDEKRWNRLLDNGYRKPVNGLVSEGVLIIHDKLKPTMALVEKTFDYDLLDEWLSEAKGPLKGAIKKQIAALGMEKEV